MNLGNVCVFEYGSQKLLFIVLRSGTIGVRLSKCDSSIDTSVPFNY